MTDGGGWAKNWKTGRSLKPPDQAYERQRHRAERVIGEPLDRATVGPGVAEGVPRGQQVRVLLGQLGFEPPEGALARFEREARHAARLSHPRLVTVFDSGVDGTSAFIVMELVVGPTLRQVLDQAGPLPDGEAVRIAAAVCEALQVAHAAGLVHRDIKPANIVLAGGGEVRSNVRHGA